MNRLEAAFDTLHAAGRKALVPYITGGYPDAATTVEILRRLDPQTCVCAEVGIPFSDPIADGPVIQTSFSRVLERGFKIDDLLSVIAAERASIRVPLVTMLSCSIVYRRGPEAFIQAAKAAGFDGMIIPDCAVEEADALAALAREHECPLVLMVAPTSGAERARRIAALSEPFIYYQSLAGVTGERRDLPADLAEHVTELRATTGKPICVGFGIGTPEHVASVCAVADGAIVGSAIVRQMNEAVDRGASASEVADAVMAVITRLGEGLPQGEAD